MLSKFIWNICPFALCTLTSLVSGTNRVSASSPPPSIGLEVDRKYSSELLGKINSVSDLADIQPDDWAFETLKSLLQRYEIPTEYRAESIDKLFHKNQALTRYEFAAGLEAVINRINELMLAETANAVTQEDLEILKRLQAEFTQELKVIKQRLEVVETRIPKHTFSTTTKLKGEVVFALSTVANTNNADDSSKNTDSHLTFSNRVRLTFETSFTGKDLLRTRLQARNFPNIEQAAGTDMANLALRGNSNNDVRLSRLEYRFPLGKRATVYLEAVAGGLDDFVSNLNPFFSGSGRGSISRFAQRNPIYRQGDGAGAGLLYKFSDQVHFSLGYVAENAEDPKNGLTQGAYGAIAQLTFQPSKQSRFGLTYIHSYNSLNTRTGSDRANDPFDDESEAIVGHSFGLQSSIKLQDNLALSGWVGFTNATATDLPGDPSANIVNWAVTLGFLDLGKEGSMAGIVIGQPPKVLSNDFQLAGRAYEDEDTAVHLEAFYRYQATDNISITPGLLVIINPEHNSSNDTIYIGTIRTTFSF
ncbi:MAG: carbohydrate porin [Scytonema sp. RU_4_4]|nr:carbohydrate porin [Scytonema sp. RU_4_4]